MINQQLSDLKEVKSSETIQKWSTQEIVEMGNTLLDKSKGEDIVQKFISKSSIKHKNMFDYSLVQYINAKTKIKIICKKHKVIFEQTPDKHLQSIHCCPNCLKENKNNPVVKSIKKFNTYEYFEKQLKNKYNIDFNLIEEYKGQNSFVTYNCEYHGLQKSTIRNLLLKNKKYSCVTCSKFNRVINNTKSPSDLINQNFTIDISTYKNRKSLLKCYCKKHGYFLKTGQKVKSGQGCFKCKVEQLVKENKLIGSYSEELFLNKPEIKNIKCIIYLLKVNNYYKIGITTKNVLNRIKGLKNKAKKYNEDLKIDVIKTKESTLYNCFLEEQKILAENKNKRLYKKWSTELLSDFDENKF